MESISLRPKTVPSDPLTIASTCSRPIGDRLENQRSRHQPYYSPRALNVHTSLSADGFDSFKLRFRGRGLLSCCSLCHGQIPSYLYFAAETILGDRVRLASRWPPS